MVSEVLHVYKNENRALRFSVNLKNEIVLSLKVLLLAVLGIRLE